MIDKDNDVFGLFESIFGNGLFRNIQYDKETKKYQVIITDVQWAEQTKSPLKGKISGTGCDLINRFNAEKWTKKRMKVTLEWEE